MNDELTIEEKAELFDLLFSCDRIRVVGMARGGEKGMTGNIRHIGMEFWDKYSMTKEEFNEYDTRDVFMEFINGLKQKDY